MCWAMKIEDMTPEEEGFSPTVDLFATPQNMYNCFVPTVWKKQYTSLGYVSNFSQWSNSEPPWTVNIHFYFFKGKVTRELVFFLFLS